MARLAAVLICFALSAGWITMAPPATASATTAVVVDNAAGTVKVAANSWEYAGYTQQYQSVRCRLKDGKTFKIVGAFLAGAPYDYNSDKDAYRVRATNKTVNEGADKNGKPTTITYHGGINLERLDPGKGKKKHPSLKIYFPGSNRDGEAGSSLHWTAVLPNDVDGKPMVTNVGTYRPSKTLKGFKPLRISLAAKSWSGNSPSHPYREVRDPRVSIRGQVKYKGWVCKPIIMELHNPNMAMQMQKTDKSLSVKLPPTAAVVPMVSNASFSTSTAASAEPEVWKLIRYLATSAPIRCGTDDKVVGRVHAGAGWELNQYSRWRIRGEKTKVFTGEIKNGKKVYEIYPAGILIHKTGKPTLSFPGRAKHSAAKSSIKLLATVPTSDGSPKYGVSGVYKPSPKLRTETFNVKVNLAAKRWKGKSPHVGVLDLWDPLIWIHTVPTYKGKACKPVTLHLKNPWLYEQQAALKKA